ncbi:MAG: hypothetical protein AUH91_03815 [Verrucomicrobia bacterium 13_1_40CM_4_54_4]|nr:MAG: hypothetical protein AUH91_03815 [Verrucomicrobia bacterium 13_1_40CM_4_54_4]
MELLREVIRRGRVIACHSVIKQRAQRTTAEGSEFAESIERVACSCALLRIVGLDLQCREIELVQIVPRLFFNGGGELLFLLGEISFRAGSTT